jgi:hypothetical protein
MDKIKELCMSIFSRVRTGRQSAGQGLQLAHQTGRKTYGKL